MQVLHIQSVRCFCDARGFRVTARRILQIGHGRAGGDRADPRASRADVACAILGSAAVGDWSRPDEARVGRPGWMREVGGHRTRLECGGDRPQRAPGRPVGHSPRYLGRRPLSGDRWSESPIRMSAAVMGCVVNGPGESKHVNIGISLPGTGERPVAPVYIDGEKGPTLTGDRIAEEFQQLVEDYVQRTYGRG
jgi:hypothetical protein